jgi:hypothetical protein
MFSATVVLTYAPPPPAAQNAPWQAVNKQLGVNLKLPTLRALIVQRERGGVVRPK